MKLHIAFFKDVQEYFIFNVQTVCIISVLKYTAFLLNNATSPNKVGLDMSRYSSKEKIRLS